jgi:HlyD family secretion protein
MRYQSSVLALTLILLAGCGHPASKSRLSEVDRLPRLETVEPLLHSILPVRIELPATVEAMEKADLCARVQGVVDWLEADIDIGRRVKAGEPLLRLAIPELEAQQRHKEALLDQARKQKLQAEEAVKVAAKEVSEAEAQEKRYAAELAFHKQTNERVVELVRRGAQQPERSQETGHQVEAADAAWQAAKAQIETKRAKWRATSADLEVAESRIRVADAEVHNLSILVSYATITAPFDGILTKRWVDRGATIKDPSMPVLTVQRTDTVRVLLDIPERDVPLVNATQQNPNPDGLGDPVEVILPALRGTVSGGRFSGFITRLASALDPVTRTMRAEVHLENPKGHLKPGMSGSAIALLEERANVLTVPSTALVRQGDRAELYCVTHLTGNPPRGVVLRLTVDLGLDDGRRVEVRGLSGKELVIAKGNSGWREGDVVFAVPTREP